MKIGILTNWRVANYVIQAYALNNVIREMFPEAFVEHLAYLEKSHFDAYYANDIKGLNNFNYNWDEIPHSIELDEKAINSYEADIIITGSDSIWEEINTGAYAFEPHLVGLGFNGYYRLIAYAPSSGTLKLSDLTTDDMKRGLKKYSAISVRDESTQEIVRKLTGKEPELVLDPSLLWDFDRDANVKNPVYKHYIAVYGVQWSDRFIEEARKFASEKGCELISIGFVNDWCDINFKRLELRMFEWLGFIKNADYVFTSTFHGLMLGISFHKQIKFDQMDFVKNRSQTLLERLGITDTVSSFDAEVDYEKVTPLLDQLRQYSLSWLWAAIAG